MYPSGDAGRFIRTRTYLPVAGCASFTSSTADSGASVVHVAASSETCIDPSAARRIQNRVTRSNVQRAPRST